MPSPHERQALRTLTRATADVETAAWLATDLERSAGQMDPALVAPLQAAVDAIVALRAAITDRAPVPR